MRSNYAGAIMVQVFVHEITVKSYLYGKLHETFKGTKVSLDGVVRHSMDFMRVSVADRIAQLSDPGSPVNTGWPVTYLQDITPDCDRLDVV